MHFLEPPTYDVIEQLKEADRVVEEKEDEEAVDNVPFDTNSIGVKGLNAKLANPINDAGVSMSVPNGNLEDTMVPLEQIMEPYQMFA
ncbi:hypothetical protein MRB53_032798 [Persea americana]|uniref:Uncharacterized protein n=1 Tax=Persea americana TaxID=3435 RepID=A0ACC2KTF8_PERAE|nr:hypothetical protein MRB53_032798 [Persea americana]